MPVVRVFSSELQGIDSVPIEVEVDVAVGLHSFTIVGLINKALNEARERVNSALKNSGLKPPNKENRRITVSLAPAGIKKSGSGYDLAIAIGYLLVTGQIRQFNTDDKLFIGEIALNGGVRPVSGAISVAEMASRLGFKYLFLPKDNFPEASIISDINLIAIENLSHVIRILSHNDDYLIELENKKEMLLEDERELPSVDISDITGQVAAKRALLIAATGGHNILLNGPPGMGKSLLAQSIAGILPDLTPKDAIEVTKIYSTAGLTRYLIKKPPFRAPHHSSSSTALVGGGSEPRPGEVSLAHKGVLFLDEIAEFRRNAIEILREPIEKGFVSVNRLRSSCVFPAKFILIAAMNPCPCGFNGDIKSLCICSPYEVRAYQAKISGPILDRIDMRVNVSRVTISELTNKNVSQKNSARFREIVERGRDIQRKRFKELNLTIRTNSEMTNKEVEKVIKLNRPAKEFLNSLDTGSLSARGYFRILKVARTIADIDGNPAVTVPHIAEAFSYKMQN